MILPGAQASVANPGGGGTIITSGVAVVSNTVLASAGIPLLSGATIGAEVTDFVLTAGGR